MLGWLKAAVAFSVKMYGWVKQVERPSVLDALPFAVSQLLPAVQRAIEFQGLNTQEKFDAWLFTVDQATGVDAGAVDFIGGMPADKEEIFWDHLIEAARVYGYCIIGVKGFTVESESNPGLGPTAASMADRIPSDINPDEEAARAAAQSDVSLIEWKVTLDCEIGFSPSALLSAWTVRLPNAAIRVHYDRSEENKTVFATDVFVKASNNEKAVSMASGLLNRHFQSIIILTVTAETVEG